MLTRGLGPLIGKPGQSSAPVGRLLNEHANACARAVLAGGKVAAANHAQGIDQAAIVEAFPSSFLGLMIAEPAALVARRGDRSDVFYVHCCRSGLLEALATYLLPGRRWDRLFDGVKNHDDRAALVCAITALCVAAGEYTAVGDADGWIVLPPKSFVARELLAILEVNASQIGGLAFG